MNDLIVNQGTPIAQGFMANQQLTMSSREIAALTGKRHDNVKSDIRAMLEGLNEDVLSFQDIYFDSMNREQTEYLLDRLHVECLLTGYSVPLRMAVLKRLKEMEQGIIPKTLPEALRMAADLAEQKAIAEKRLLEAAPKVQFFDTVVDRKTLMTATQVGQKLGLSAIKLNQALTSLDVYHGGVKRGRVFKQWFIDAGYGELKQTEQGFSQPLFTTSGEAWVVERLVSEGYEIRRAH